MSPHWHWAPNAAAPRSDALRRLRTETGAGAGGRRPFGRVVWAGSWGVALLLPFACCSGQGGLPLPHALPLLLEWKPTRNAVPRLVGDAEGAVERLLCVLLFAARALLGRRGQPVRPPALIDRISPVGRPLSYIIHLYTSIHHPIP